MIKPVDAELYKWEEFMKWCERKGITNQYIWWDCWKAAVDAECSS